MFATIAATKAYIINSRHIVKLHPEEEEDIQGKVVIVTGANSGIGKETTRALFQRGATVVLACRNESKAAQAIADILQTVTRDDDEVKSRSTQTHEGQMIFIQLDLAEMASVRRFAKEFRSRFGKLHILILNAGVNLVTGQRIKTVDGFEYQMAVNHLGHFLLTLLLLDILKASAPSRVISVSSFGFLYADLRLDDLMLEKAYLFPYLSLVPYGNSKLANMYFIKELARRLEGSGVIANAVCPGLVGGTDIMAGRSWWKRLGAAVLLAGAGMSPEQDVRLRLLVQSQRVLAVRRGDSISLANLGKV